MKYRLEQPEARKKYKNWFVEHHFSPTEIDRYLACPLLFFFETVMGIRTPPAPDVELTPLQIGNLVHKTLERFMRTPGKPDSGKPESGKALEQEALQLLDEETAKHPEWIKPLVQRQKQLIFRALHTFLEQETLARSLDPDLKPLFFEWSFDKFVLKLGAHTIHLTGRIDRIDVDEKKRRFLVIDYKTGASQITGRQIQNGESFQIPLYILAVEKLLLPGYEPIGGVYYQLSDMTKKNGLLHADRLSPSLEIGPRSSSLVPGGRWGETFDSLTAQLVNVIQEMSEGLFQPNEAHCPSRCPLKIYCETRI